MKKKLQLKKNLNKLRRNIFLSGTIFLSIFSIAGAISVSVPTQNNADDVIVSGPSTINSQEREVFEIIQIVNKYLRFAIGAVCMGILIFAGIKLMTADGNADEMKKVNTMLIGSVAGILISVLSYAIVRIVVNLL